MKQPINQPSKGIVSIRLLAGLAIVSLVPILLFADPPGWWAARNVTNGNQANDYAAINQGQLKNIAVKAYQEMRAGLPNGVGTSSSGTALTGLITSWGTFNGSGTFIETSGTATNDYAAVNIGQVKHVASLFYNVLLQAGYNSVPLVSGTYPWLSSTNAPNDYAAANIGQVKNLFSFDLSVFLPIWWQEAYFGTTGIDPGADPAGDGLSNMQKYLQGLNPLQEDNPAVQLNVNVIVR